MTVKLKCFHKLNLSNFNVSTLSYLNWCNSHKILNSSSEQKNLYEVKLASKLYVKLFFMYTKNKDQTFHGDCLIYLNIHFILEE